MDEFTSAFLSRGKDELKDVENSMSFTPFGSDVPETSTDNDTVPEPHKPEPESVKQWQREFSAGIEKRDAMEAKKDKEMKDNAAKVCPLCYPISHILSKSKYTL